MNLRLWKSSFLVPESLSVFWFHSLRAQTSFPSVFFLLLNSSSSHCSSGEAKGPKGCWVPSLLSPHLCGVSCNFFAYSFLPSSTKGLLGSRKHTGRGPTPPRFPSCGWAENRCLSSTEPLGGSPSPGGLPHQEQGDPSPQSRFSPSVWESVRSGTTHQPARVNRCGPFSRGLTGEAGRPSPPSLHLPSTCPLGAPTCPSLFPQRGDLPGGWGDNGLGAPAAAFSRSPLALLFC